MDKKDSDVPCVVIPLIVFMELALCYLATKLIELTQNIDSIFSIGHR